MKLVWERVESTGIGYGSFFRAEVPGGFILLMDMLNDNGSNSVTMIFVPKEKGVINCEPASSTDKQQRSGLFT
jgi:ABC-type Fe3+ transport system substrate-binding protein